MGARKLNLNHYEICKEEDADIAIVPQERDGVQHKTIFYKKKDKGKNEITADMIANGNIKWYPAIKISTKGTQNEYTKCIEWWFRSADDEYRSRISETFKRIKDLTREVDRAKLWLITNGAKITRNGKYPKRRNDINTFLQNWLSKNESFL